MLSNNLFFYLFSFLKKERLLFHAIAEIRRVSGFNQTFMDHERVEHESPFRSLSQHPNGRPMDLEGWPAMQMEVMLIYGHHS